MAPPPSAAATTSVQVALRIRPSTAQDAVLIPARFQRTILHASSPTSVAVDAAASAPTASGSIQAQPTSAAAQSAKKQTFSFDQVHAPSTTQHALYMATANPLIDRFIEGFNCTILAYGQTSSGKTYSMTGIDLDADPTDPNNGMGIIPRSIAAIFSRAKALKEQRAGAWSFSIKGSFIEIYNEDLIDLLVTESASARREVQIREDKEGNIIWGGLREVDVRNVADVMSLIVQGTSIRRTNETDMNAQSSRSHAIFSLTLTQRKFSGAGPPPRSPSPMPPVGASRIARPGSISAHTSGRVGSPTFGRPQTPSFAVAMGRGSLRPGSAMGQHNRPATPDDDAGPGEWTTIVSKFHFVDLAGSERLKRTAAAGERIKEGISINSGLLALGNVISALGDPSRAKTHTATHVPYRDSKLTRLLQDSLGGNAQTLMIACVSAAEWNAAETVNTLKYANRARNIRNRAEIREKEEGWEDIEWLQNMVTRLRKDLKGLKDGGAIVGPDGDASAPAREPVMETDRASKKVLAQVVELQENYQELRERYVERTEELTRLRRELGEQHRSSGGASGGMSKYEEIVGPVIEEYEKTISAIEAELKLNRAALRHTNELVSEKEEELSVVTERHASTESYVQELRARIAKLAEREASTESYIHDLEEKIKTYDDSSMSSSSSVSELKREIGRYKATESSSAEYIAELEARLARSDESVLSLRASVEALEHDADARRNEVEALQARMQALKADGEGWRSELEERERRVTDLEKQLSGWEQRRRDAGADRERLGEFIGGVERAKNDLERNIARTTDASGSPLTSIPPAHDELHEQLLGLQQTHTATLADLSAVSAKYRDALREISELASQIADAKLHSGGVHDQVDSSPEPAPRPRRGTFSSTRAKELGEGTAAARRRFFRHAASSDSLHARSQSQSLSLSQELSSARSPKPSLTRSMTSPHGSFDSIRSGPLSPTFLVPPVPQLLPPLQISHSERSVDSLEKEIMRLQEVLKEREVEISALEDALKDKTNLSSSPLPHSPVLFTNTDELDHRELSPGTINQFDKIRQAVVPESDGQESADPSESLGRLDELMRSMAQKESQHREVVEDLNAQLKQVRRQHDELVALSRDQALNMSTELEVLRDQLRGSRETHSSLSAELGKLRAREAEILHAQAAASLEHAAAIDRMRGEHGDAMRAKEEHINMLMDRIKTNGDDVSSLRDQLADAAATLDQSHKEHDAAFGSLRSEHQIQLKERAAQVEELLAATRREHEQQIDDLSSEHFKARKAADEEASAAVSRGRAEHQTSLDKLRADHADAVTRIQADSVSQMERLRKEHAGYLQRLEIAREGSMSESQASQLNSIRQMEEAHVAAMREKDIGIAEDLERLNQEHVRGLTSISDDHAVSMDRLEKEHAIRLAQVDAERAAEAEAFQSKLAAANLAHRETVDGLKADAEACIAAAKTHHTSVLEEFERDHAALTASLRAEHASSLASLTLVHEQTLVAAETRRVGDLDAMRTLHESLKSDMLSRHTEEKSALQQHWADELSRLHADHSSSVHELLISHEGKVVELQRIHSEETFKLKAAHRQALADAEASFAQSQVNHTTALEEARIAGEKLVVDERERQVDMLTELDRIHAQERETLKKDLELMHGENARLAQELASHRTIADETAISHDTARLALTSALKEKDGHIASLESQLIASQDEHASSVSELAQVKAELQRSRIELGRHEAALKDANAIRTLLHEVQADLHRSTREHEILQAERTRQDVLVKELHAQVAAQANARASPQHDARSGPYSRMNGTSSIRLPPLTPPPSVPPPPVPTDVPPLPSDASRIASVRSTVARSSDSSNRSMPDSPGGTPTSTSATSLAPTINGVSQLDSNSIALLEEKDQTIEEQDTMIRTLNKQLTHCEGDLQAHMDLVATLETSLSDSERNLRKARVQASELVKERDSLNKQVDGLRAEIREAKSEMVNIRRSVVEEKQTLENRLDDERRAKERAKAQLDSRMEELQRRKSKFACM